VCIEIRDVPRQCPLLVCDFAYPPMVGWELIGFVLGLSWFTVGELFCVGVGRLMVERLEGNGNW
jgi:hypothetical protein